MSRKENIASEIEVEKTLKTGTLNLRNYKITQIPPEVFSLTHLTRLDLGRNSLNEISEDICNLTSLKELLLNENQLVTIPSSLSALKTLEFIDLGMNCLTKFPNCLTHLTNLEYLRIGGNAFKTFPDNVANLKELKTLIADNIGLRTFPAALTKLRDLRVLNLSNNALTDLPQEFTKLTKLRTFAVDGNYLTRPPLEIVSRGPGAIINYLHAFDKSEGSFQIREAKLLIVGQGAVGKTCLMNRIIHDEVNPSVATTEGIHIDQWPFRSDDGEPFCVNFWDFGGQEIYHSTHQFFLTKRSLYMFVWDARKEDNLLGFDYWLNVVKLLSDHSPLLVVLNKTDERVKTIDEDSLREKFPNILSFHRVSAFSGSGIPELKADIMKNIVSLEHVGDVLPKAWMQIRKHLEAMKVHSISYSSYLRICAIFGLDEEKANYLSQYFHDLGVFLHFQENPILKQVVFLEPEWATNAVYKIVDTKDVQLAFGSFTYDQLEKFWEAYPRERRVHLLELMKKFEICFQIPETDKYVVPELLSAKRPTFQWDDKDSLHFVYKYEFMPVGVITRFIVRTHDMNRGIYWKNGVVLKRDNTAALVVSEPLSRRIKIQIAGEDKRSLLAVIRREIDYIHKTLNNPAVAATLPCICETCRGLDEPYFHDFDYLRRARAKRKWTVECKKSLEDVRVEDILGEVRAPRTSTTQVNIYGDYYESRVSNIISIGHVQLNREYSDELRLLAGVSPEQYGALIIKLAKLSPYDLEQLQEYAAKFNRRSGDGALLEKIRTFAARHNVPLLQNMIASGLYELLKYLFLA
ncbi:MAG TPA: COR domain-containing protein [Pyrinomonadaceae bacterium]|nr:COR domain-containing protein [Pyrinomonadaceae bacterium]